MNSPGGIFAELSVREVISQPLRTYELQIYRLRLQGNHQGMNMLHIVTEDIRGRETALRNTYGDKEQGVIKKGKLLSDGGKSRWDRKILGEYSYQKRRLEIIIIRTASVVRQNNETVAWWNFASTIFAKKQLSLNTSFFYPRKTMFRNSSFRRAEQRRRRGRRHRQRRRRHRWQQQHRWRCWSWKSRKSWS